MRQIISMVKKRMGNENQIAQETQPIGGSYVHLEAEWRERHRQNKSKLSVKWILYDYINVQFSILNHDLIFIWEASLIIIVHLINRAFVCLFHLIISSVSSFNFNLNVKTIQRVFAFNIIYKFKTQWLFSFC